MTWPAAIPAVERNSTLFRLAKSAAGKGVPEAAQLRKAWQVNADRCHPPLSDEEVRQLVANAYTARGGGAVSFPLAVMDSPEFEALGDAERPLLLVAYRRADKFNAFNSPWTQCGRWFPRKDTFYAVRRRLEGPPLLQLTTTQQKDN